MNIEKYINQQEENTLPVNVSLLLEAVTLGMVKCFISSDVSFAVSTLIDTNLVDGGARVSPTFEYVGLCFTILG